MTSPPPDDAESNGPSPSDRSDRDADPDDRNRKQESTRTPDADPAAREDTARSRDVGISARDTSGSSDGSRTTAPGDSPTSERDPGATAGASTRAVDDPLGDLLPRAGVDSRWWYWIAAIPLYVVFGAMLAVLFVGVLIFDLFLTGGIATVFGAFVVVPVLGLVGLALTVLFPVATYIDARAIAESEAEWAPDPLVWGLAALATVVLSAFTVSVLQALYYLYRRHVAVGTP
mgnify:CR=1 FL=1